VRSGKVFPGALGLRPMRPILLVALALVLAGCASTPSTPSATTPSGGTTPAGTNNTTSGGGAGIITVQTSKGTFSFQLDPQDAPKTSAHIADLVKKGFYDGIPFHRYVADFVIQGGDPNCKGDGWKDPSSSGCGTGGSGTTVPLEAGGAQKHDYGAVGLARANDPNSGDSQFYVVNAKNGAHFLDGQYTVFGKVTSGMDVVDQLRAGDLMTKVTWSAG